MKLSPNILSEVKLVLSKERFDHSLGVMQTARSLALRHGADPEKASLAGLVHDYARDLGDEVLLDKAQEFGLIITPMERAFPKLLHGPVAAQLIERELGIDDKGILSAVARHTTGGPDMALLDKIIYVADYIEPGRSFPGVIRLRQAAWESIDQGLLLSFESTIRYLMERKLPIDPKTVDGRNFILLEGSGTQRSHF